MIYKAIKKRNGDIYLCPAQLESAGEYPLTPEQLLIIELDDRATELERELTKLKESQTQKSIIKLCNRVDKAEAEKAELIKKMVELAEGFEYNQFGCVSFYDNLLSCTQEVIGKWCVFPLLIRRAVEGFNKRNSIVIYAKKNSVCLCNPSVYDDKYFWYDDYSDPVLTKQECAMFHCLQEVLK